MSYSPTRHQEIRDKEAAKLSKQISICQEVQHTVSSKGWQNTIAPIIDKMIIDILGGKIGDTWVSGKLDRAKTDEKREFYIGAKQALIDLHARVMFHLQQLPLLEENLKKLIKDKETKFKVPLVDDSKYNTEG